VVETGDTCLPGGATINFCDSNLGPGGLPLNTITSFLDASTVYGNSAQELEELRGGGPGELLVSQSEFGPLLPPATGGVFFQFRAGDERVNENPALTSIHTLFVREHNRLVSEAIADATAIDPSVVFDMEDDEALFEFARERNAAQIQAITFNEILPLLIGELPAYAGYNPDTDPQVMIDTGVYLFYSRTLSFLSFIFVA
jgi:hypothetical protein